MTILILSLLAAELTEIKPRMQQFVDSGDLAGIVTLVQRNGERLHLEAVGWQDREKQIPMKTDSIFEVMSMTKPVTSVAIMMLAEEGLLTLNDPVARHLPEFRPKKITIRDLLTHTSGLAEMGPEGVKELYLKHDLTLKEAVLVFSQMPLLTEPGTRFQYSNPGIATLGRIVEVVGREPYDKFIAERIFKPLGMKDSFFFVAPEKAPRIAMTYVVDKGKMGPAGDLIYRKGAVYPMPEGGMYSTAEDMAKFYQCMLGGGKPLISKTAVEVMTANHTGDIMGDKAGWGLGWQIDRQTGAYGHGGAFGTHGWVEPKRGLVRVFMVQKFGAKVDEPRNAFANLVSSTFPN